MTKKNILITGSSGLIGSILTKSLSEKFETYGLDTIGEGAEKYYTADISDFAELNKVFSKLPKLDCAIHLGADANPKATWGSVLKNNIIGTKNIYECVKEYKLNKVIFASSNRVTEGYEDNPTKLIFTKDPIRPRNYYGVTKVFGEAIARQFFELYKIKSICLRIGTVLRDDNPTIDELEMRKWLSHKDLIQLFEKCLESDIEFGIYYGVSNNKGRFWDISNAERDLGYKPQDDSYSLT